MAILVTRRRWLVTSLCAASRSPCSRQRLASMYSSWRSKHREPPDFLKIMGKAGFGREDRQGRVAGHNQALQLVSKRNYLLSIGCQVNFETLLYFKEAIMSARETAELLLQVGRLVQAEGYDGELSPAQWMALRFFA